MWDCISAWEFDISSLPVLSAYMLNNKEFIHYPVDSTPQLIAVIDTEEEFDWQAEPDPNATSVKAISELHLIQDVFNEYNIKPCYVVDHPIASQKLSVDVISEFYKKGQCEIGAHLHPWVSPPYEEELNRRNMFPGNLDYELEYKKLKNLTELIKKSFGLTPEIYRAGRYGIGKNTASILKKLNYKIDLSICSGIDFSYEGGPDFSDSFAQPFWFGENNDLLEIPLSGAFVGKTGKFSKFIYNSAGHLHLLKARAILSRLSIVDRLMLSPEGFTTKEHKKLTQYLYDRGVRVFSWNLHSTSVVPGLTSYNKTEKDVNDFLDSFRRYFDYFFEELNGVTTTPTQVKKDLDNAHSD